MAVPGAGALAALKGYLWVQDGEFLKASLLGAGSVLGLTVAGWGWWRWKQPAAGSTTPSRYGRRSPASPSTPSCRWWQSCRNGAVSSGPRNCWKGWPPPTATSIIPPGPGSRSATYNPWFPPTPAPRRAGLFGKRSVLGVREAAALWHPPGERDETPLVERSGSRSLLPPVRGTAEGALVGDTTGGQTREIRSPRTCCAATTSTWPAPAWASPP